MSQNNFGREYQIPSGPHNPIHNTPVGVGFDISSQNTFLSEHNIEVKKEYEAELHPLSVTMRAVHGLIDEARNNKVENYSTINNRDNGGVFRGIVRTLFVYDVASTIKPRETQNTLTKTSLIDYESIEGGAIFGGNNEKNIKFFCDEHGEWFYCEEVESKDGKPQYKVLHYIAYDSVVLAIKDVPGQRMQHEHLDANSQEAKHLNRAVEMYYERVMQNVYPESNIVNLDEHRKNGGLSNKLVA